jgi:hypothetical protein
MEEYNLEQVLRTLSKVTAILDKYKVEYRFLGSVVTAAINGKLHRKLGDLDLIVDISGKDALYQELIKLGYFRARGMFSFARKYMELETLEHSSLLGVGFFYGKWKPDGSFLLGNQKIYVTIENRVLTKTKYNLYGVNFFGLPEEVIATGIKTSENNPKRKKELMLLKEKNITPLKNNYIHISFFGLKVDWIYHFVMSLFNFIGDIRVTFGLAFDPWR